MKRARVLGFGVVLALLGIAGCGGETGGSPSGIARALTNATLRVNSFTLSAANAGVLKITPVDLSSMELGTSFAPDGTVRGIAGTLYPNRNSKSFRVALKGARSNLEDAYYYYNVFDDAGLDSAASEAPDAVVKEEPIDGVTTQYTRLYVALRPGGEIADPVTGDKTPYLWPLKPLKGRDQRGHFRFALADDPTETPIDTTAATKDATAGDLATPGIVYRVEGAYTYLQPGNRKAIREGGHSVIVQFFNRSADSIQASYDQIASAPTAADAAEREKELLAESLTNSYVFTATIQPDIPQIPLTGQFEANNGGNGLVESGELEVKATGLPARWGSVTFEAYEESYTLGKPGIVFSKTVNVTDGGDPSFARFVATHDPLSGGAGFPSTVETTLPYANRQRVLKVYATCYELPNATGAVLAQTVERGKYNGTPDEGYTDFEPVMFIPTAQAQLASVFNDGAPLNAPAADLLKSLKLYPAISNVTPSVPLVLKGGDQLVKVVADSDVYPRFAFPVARTGQSPTTIPRTLSNVGFLFTPTATSVAGFDMVVGSEAVLRIDKPDGPVPGRVSWPLDGDLKFSQITHPKAAAAIAYTPYYPLLDPDVPRFAAPLSPTQGSASGVIRGARR